MDCFREYVQTYTNTHGDVGFDIITWPVRHINCILFQLGRLGFEMQKFGFENAVKQDHDMIRKQDHVLWVHIPANGRLDHEKCKKSYTLAKNFFDAYFPDYRAKYFCCSSWLLHPALKDVLPPDSNIIKFQNDFNVFHTTRDNDPILSQVFGSVKDDISLYPTDTTLRKNVIAYLQEGKSFGEGVGYYKIN